MKNGSYVVGLFAAAILLVGCSSSGTTAESSTAAATSASATASSAVSSSSASSSRAASSSVSPTSSSSSKSSAASSPAASAASGNIDAQTAAWFDTFCNGVAVLGGLGEDTSSVQQLSQQLTTIGTSFTDTAAKLAALPPPTFEGGEEVAQQLVTNMEQGGPLFTEYGQRAAQLDPNDQAAGQQFQADFQAAVSGLGIANFEPTPAAKAAVREVPSCQVLGT